VSSTPSDALPVRRRPPWLPPLRYQVSDMPMWWYRQSVGPGEGAARLRVWRAGSGHLAVASWLGFGLPVAEAVPDLWYSLLALLPGPLALAEHGGQDDTEFVRLAAVCGSRVAWHRLFPVAENCQHHDHLSDWWMTYGQVILVQGRTWLGS
jgi:hypothetical protein